ncbi:hypothetical protein GOODEAATRI_017768, partial [Goodea atripinnis]
VLCFSCCTDLDTRGKIMRVLTSIVKLILLVGLLYLFICSLDVLSSAFQLVGVLDVKSAIPIIMGANIGTSVTNTIVAVMQAGDRNEFRRLAKGLGNKTAKYRWFAAVYLLLCFLVLPLAVFGLSIAGWQVLVGIGAPIVMFIIIVIIINVMQSRCPRFLPKFLRNWDFLPRPLHSMAPWDKMLTSSMLFCGKHCCCCCKCSNCCSKDEEAEKISKTSRKSLEMYDNPAMSTDKDTAENIRATQL